MKTFFSVRPIIIYLEVQSVPAKRSLSHILMNLAKKKTENTENWNEEKGRRVEPLFANYGPSFDGNLRFCNFREKKKITVALLSRFLNLLFKSFAW